MSSPQQLSQCDQPARINTGTSVYMGVLRKSPVKLPYFCDFARINAGVSILTSYGEKPHYVKLPIFSEFMENSTKFMKNSDLTKWTQNLR